MTIVWLLRLLRPAAACSPLEGLHTLISPTGGEVPPGFAIRYDGSGGVPELVDETGNAVELTWGPSAALLTPTDLPLGDYKLSDSHRSYDLTVVTDPAGTPPRDEPVLNSVWLETDRVPEAMTGTCRGIYQRNHRILTVDIAFPETDQAGWVVEFSDRANDAVALFDATDEGATAQFDLGRTTNTDEACPTLWLFNPLHELEAEVEGDCIQPTGCSTTGTSSGILSLSILLLWRRTRGASSRPDGSTNRAAIAARHPDSAPCRFRRTSIGGARRANVR